MEDVDGVDEGLNSGALGFSEGAALGDSEDNKEGLPLTVLLENVDPPNTEAGKVG